MAPDRVLERWRRSRASSERGADSGLVYTVIVVAAILVPALTSLVASLLRPLWNAAESSGSGPFALLVVVPALFVAGMAVGRYQGPAVRHPFLTWVIAQGPGPRWPAFKTPILMTGAIAVAIGACLGAGGVLAAGGVSGLGWSAAVGLVLLGGASGAVAVCGALLGQSSPRAGRTALGILLIPATVAGLAALGLVPALSLVLGAAIATAAALLAITFCLREGRRDLEDVDPAHLLAHSVRWNHATAFAWTFDLAGMGHLYLNRPPRVSRGSINTTVLLSGSFSKAMLVRGWVGWCREPARSFASLLLTSAGLWLMGNVVLGTFPGGWAVAAYVMVHTGLPGLMTGMRHAVGSAVGPRLWGVSDGRLLAAATFPVILVSGVAVLIACLGLLPASEASPSEGAVVLVLLVMAVLTCFAVHLAQDLRGPMPAVLHVPVASGLGDPMILVRLAWPFEGLLLAGLLGYLAELMPPVVVVVLGVLLAGPFFVFRWLRRDG